MALGLIRGATLQGGAGRASKSWTTIPAQNLKIGNTDFGKVQFIDLAGAQKNANTSAFDGLLTMGQFKRALICPTDHVAVLEPW